MGEGWKNGGREEVRRSAGPLSRLAQVAAACTGRSDVRIMNK